jgi:hypothetical protein
VGKRQVVSSEWRVGNTSTFWKLFKLAIIIEPGIKTPLATYHLPLALLQALCSYSIKKVSRPIKEQLTHLKMNPI